MKLKLIKMMKIIKVIVKMKTIKEVRKNQKPKILSKTLKNSNKLLINSEFSPDPPPRINIFWPLVSSSSRMS